MPSRVLLVEGPSDQHVVWALLKHHRIPEAFVVQAAGGDVREDDRFERMLQTVETRLRVVSDLERLAVVLDADQHIGQRWQSLRDRISRSGLGTLPAEPNESGTVIDLPKGRRLGIWLMPNNRLSGMMEDFLAFLVPEDDQLLQPVDEFLDGLPATARRFRNAHRSKARIHTWLSVQDEPDGRLGLAITRQCLDPNCDVAQEFIDWVKRVLLG